MEWEYRTKQGDTWDVLALDIYGTEMLAWWLQQANPDYLDTVYFRDGVILTIPETPVSATARPLPPWERNNMDSESII